MFGRKVFNNKPKIKKRCSAVLGDSPMSDCIKKRSRRVIEGSNNSDSARIEPREKEARK